MGEMVRDSSTNESQLVLTWSALTTDADKGGDAIDSYNVQWSA